MNSSVISSLRGVAKTKLFAIFAVSFFLLLSAIIVILFTSQSFTPSIEQLQSMIVKDIPPAAEYTSPNNSDMAVLGATTNAQAFLFNSTTQTAPITYEYDVTKTRDTITKAQSTAPAFVLRTNEVEGFMVFITGKLGLNQVQSATIITAINAQLDKANSDYVRISLIARKTLDTTLTQSTTSQKLPTVKDRIFFYVAGTADTESASVPEITPLSFKNPLELGVVSL